MVVGGLIGIVLTAADELAPQHLRRWIPSPVGLGIAGVIPAFNSVSMFVGALAAWILSKNRPSIDRQYTIPVSIGLIAGESLTGVVIILAEQAPSILDNL